MSFFINQDPQVLLTRAALSLFIPQSVVIIAPAQVQHFGLGSAELHEICTGTLLKSVQVPLYGVTSLGCINCTTQLGAICRLAECALFLTVCVVKKAIK